jgi:hypothetical protein
MATDPPAQATAWIIEHAGQVVGETHRGDDWRQAVRQVRVGAGVALVEDPEGNRALLVRRRPDEPVRFSPARRPRS